MDIVRIKCPACEVVLEVRNSKQESVKHITCPQCKKSLAVNFHQESTVPTPSHTSTPQPFGILYCGRLSHRLHAGINHIVWLTESAVTVKVVRLADGSTKCIIGAPSANHSVAVNGQVLQTGDEIVLQKGDLLVVDNREITYDTVGKALPPIVSDDITPNIEMQIPWRWVGIIASVIILAFVSYATWTQMRQSQSIQEIVISTDTIKRNPPQPKSAIGTKLNSTPRESELSNSSRHDNSTSPSRLSKNSNSDNLEQKAANGDVTAQYQLGVKWIQSAYCEEVIKGEYYLQVAASKGSKKAMRVLAKFYRQGSPKCGIARNDELANQYENMALQ